jgi:hypothetical protein
MWSVTALAIARSRGKLDIGGETTRAEGATEALLRAVAISTQHYEHKRDDNTVKTNHGEILSFVPDRRDEALRLLTSLENTDLMTSAFGYAALARLRHRAGEGRQAWIAPALVALNRAPAALASSRCERMAKNKEICSWKPAT